MSRPPSPQQRVAAVAAVEAVRRPSEPVSASPPAPPARFSTSGAIRSRLPAGPSSRVAAVRAPSSVARDAGASATAYVASVAVPSPPVARGRRRSPPSSDVVGALAEQLVVAGEPEQACRVPARRPGGSARRAAQLVGAGAAVDALDVATGCRRARSPAPSVSSPLTAPRAEADDDRRRALGVARDVGRPAPPKMRPRPRGPGAGRRRGPPSRRFAPALPISSSSALPPVTRSTSASIASAAVPKCRVDLVAAHRAAVEPDVHRRRAVGVGDVVQRPVAADVDVGRPRGRTSLSLPRAAVRVSRRVCRAARRAPAPPITRSMSDCTSSRTPRGAVVGVAARAGDADAGGDGRRPARVAGGVAPVAAREDVRALARRRGGPRHRCRRGGFAPASR